MWRLHSSPALLITRFLLKCNLVLLSNIIWWTSLAWMSGTLPISIHAPVMLTCHVDAPTCPLSALQRLATLQTQSQCLVSMPVAAQSHRGARSPETEGGRSVRQWVGAGGAETGGVGWWGSLSVLLAFTGSPRIAKFFSNLQLLDVGANHQRGSPRAYPPYHPSLPPHPCTIFSPSGAPSHSGLFTYSCVYLLFHRLRLSRREEASSCENSH